MKILLLSCSTGEGHNSAARAIKSVADSMNIECDIRDPVSFRSERASRRLAGAYNNTIKYVPKLFGAVYGIGHIYDKTVLPSPIYAVNRGYARKLADYLKENKYDCVISTHLYGMEATKAVNKNYYRIPSYAVLTDYTCVPFFAGTDIDGYFIPHKDLMSEMIEKGLKPELLYDTGIPVNSRFMEGISKKEARERIGGTGYDRIYLIMSGGVGCGHVGAFCDEIIKNEKGNYYIFILSGKNVKLKAKLEEKFEEKRVSVIGFTDKVYNYMKAADVVISKPGGLSSTEIAATRVPIVHVMTIPGCETRNVHFFEEHGMSRFAESEEAVGQIAVEIANNPEIAEEMVENQKKNIRPDSAYEILRIVKEKLNIG